LSNVIAGHRIGGATGYVLLLDYQFSKQREKKGESYVIRVSIPFVGIAVGSSYLG
jgi:hypothetical protein